MKNRFTVFWIGGENDGKIIRTFKKEQEAYDFAFEFVRKREKEFDPVCGGIGVMDDFGNIIW